MFYAPRQRPDARFCSQTCKGIASRKPFPCEVCGTVVPIGYRSRSKRWCSKACAGKARASGAVYHCVQCSRPVYRPRAYPFGVRGVFCGKACWDAHQTYSPERLFYGSRWLAARRLALQRDGHACQGCGVAARRVRGGLHVHHIIPFRLWPDQDTANQQVNLIALCPSCHKRADLAYHATGAVLFGIAPAFPPRLF